jgi:hypothetical protein
MSFCRIREGELCAQQSEILKSIEKLEEDYKDDYNFNSSGKFSELQAQITNLTKIKTDYKKVIDYLQQNTQATEVRKIEKIQEINRQRKELRELENKKLAVDDLSNLVLNESISLNHDCIRLEKEKNHKDQQCQSLGERLDDMKRSGAHM